MPLLLPDLVDRADARVVQRRGSFGFALEAAQSLRVLGHIVGQEFKSDKAAEVGVLGLVDHTHAAAAQLFDNTVVRDDRVEHWREAMLFRRKEQVNESQ